MKRRISAILAGMCVMAIAVTGCSKEVSNDNIVISQYKGLEVEKVETTTVSDEAIEEQIQSMLQYSATQTEVTDRAAKLGDTVTITYVGMKDGEAFEGGSAEGYQLELGSGSFIDGFEDGIVGHNIGDNFDLNLTFPETYKNNPDLAGEDVVFNVLLTAITEVAVPELTDEWVQTVSENSKTVDEYRAELKEMMTTYYENVAKSELENAVWEAFLENVTVNTYDTEELQAIIKLSTTQYQSKAEEYELEFADFLDTYYGMTEDEFNSQVASMAKDQLKETYATNLVIEKEKIDVSDEKLREVYEEYLDYFGAEDVDQLIELMEEDGLLESLQDLAKSHIVRDFLVDNCKQVEKVESDSTESSAE